MQHYEDIGCDSGVSAYETGIDSITVRFKDGSLYLYTYGSAGSAAIEKMKELAANGNGLNAYINRCVKKAYAQRIR
jgi:hypothetical protein